MTAAPVLTLGGVDVRLGRRFTLSLGHLAVDPGVTAVLGPNGSGKTTLLRLLATALRPTAGTLSAAGADLSAPDALHRYRSMLGYLPQDDTVPRRMRAFDHVDLIAVLRDIGTTTTERRRHVIAAMRTTDVDDLAHERAGTLSGGQRRRVALAAALCGDPPVLVLDEPDANLDIEHKRRLAERLDARRGASTVVLSSHDAGWAEGFADRVIRLDAGQLV